MIDQAVVSIHFTFMRGAFSFLHQVHPLRPARWVYPMFGFLLYFKHCVLLLHMNYLCKWPNNIHNIIKQIFAYFKSSYIKKCWCISSHECSCRKWGEKSCIWHNFFKWPWLQKKEFLWEKISVREKLRIENKFQMIFLNTINR